MLGLSIIEFTLNISKFVLDGGNHYSFFKNLKLKKKESNDNEF